VKGRGFQGMGGYLFPVGRTIIEFSGPPWREPIEGRSPRDVPIVGVHMSTGSVTAASTTVHFVDNLLF
jgi:hypothetical protein